MERGARRATVLGITESDMTERLSTQHSNRMPIPTLIVFVPDQSHLKD